MRLRAKILIILGFTVVGTAFWTREQGLLVSSTAFESAQEGTAVVEKRDFEVTLKATGIIRPISQRTLGTIVSGIIENIYFEVGDRVEKGAIVASVDARLQAAVVEGLQEQLLGEREFLKASKNEYNRLTAHFENQLELHNLGSVTTYDLEKTKSELLMAEGRYRQQIALVKKIDAELSSESFAYGQRYIIAPISGTLLSRQAEVGSVYLPSAGSNAILTLADLSRVRAELWFSEVDIREISVGQIVEIGLLGDPGMATSAKIARIQPEPIKPSGIPMYVADVELDNEDGKLISGMTVRASVVVANKKDALVLPLSTIYTDPKGKSWVMIKTLAATKNLEVQVSLQDLTYASLIGDLRVGDLVFDPYPTPTLSSTRSP